MREKGHEAAGAVRVKILGLRPRRDGGHDKVGQVVDEDVERRQITPRFLHALRPTVASMINSHDVQATLIKVAGDMAVPAHVFA